MTARDIATSRNKKEIVSLLENEERIWSADIKCKEGQYEEAIEEYSKAIELEPMNTLAYEHRGVAKASLRQYEEAIKDYNIAIELEPKNKLAYEHRGIAKANMGLYESAIEDYQTVLTIEHTYVLE